ncbi:MAG: hypothetical protein HY376_01905 [Candidatus Blackburnbacteria bacterium]|nr:hypothetical protein [Candidatus Blackburnbacteria bacterium]
MKTSVADNYDIVARAGNVTVTVEGGGTNDALVRITESTASLLSVLQKDGIEAQTFFCKAMQEVCLGLIEVQKSRHEKSSR